MIEKILAHKKFIISYLLIITVCSIQSPCDCGSSTEIDPPTDPPTAAPFTLFAESHGDPSSWDPLDTVKFGTKSLRCGALTQSTNIFLIAGTDTADLPTIWRSTDFGNTFVPVFQGACCNPFIAMKNTTGTGTTIAAVTQDGKFYISNNEGATWTETANLGGTITDMDFFSSGLTGIAVGKTGDIIRTQNGGFSWTAMASGTTNDLNSVCCIGPGLPDDTIIVTGNVSTICRSTNQGMNWTVQTAGTSNLYAVGFSETRNGRYGILFCDIPLNSNKEIYKTTDGGTTWTLISSGSSNGYYDMLVSNSGKCLMSGDNGIYYSTDSGVNWIQANYSSISLYNLSTRDGVYTGNNYVFAVGK